MTQYVHIDNAGNITEFINITRDVRINGLRAPAFVLTALSAAELKIENIAEVKTNAMPAYDPITQDIRSVKAVIGTSPLNTWQVSSKSVVDIETARIEGLKSTCRVKIFGRYSDSDQRNGAMEAIKLVRLAAGDGLTSEQQVRADELDYASMWIQNMVVFCRAKIADGSTVVEVEDLWPSPPA